MIMRKIVWPAQNLST